MTIENILKSLNIQEIKENQKAYMVYALAATGVAIPIEIQTQADNAIARTAGFEAPKDGLEWQIGVWLPQETIITHNGALFAVLQGHFTKSIWSPEHAHSLFEQIRKQYLPWSRPGGAFDAYRIGDRFIFEGWIWEVLIDNLVHNPTEFPQGFERIREVEE